MSDATPSISMPSPGQRESDILEDVRARLKIPFGSGPDPVQSAGRLRDEYRFVRQQIALQCPCVGDPDALTGPSMDFFDKAVTLALARRQYSILVTGLAQGVTLSEKTADGSQETFAAPRAQSPEEWAVEFADALGRIPCVQASYQSALADFSMFGLAGRTRLSESRGVFPSLLAFGLGLLDTGAFPLLGYAGTDYYRNGDGNGFLFGEAVSGV